MAVPISRRVWTFSVVVLSIANSPASVSSLMLISRSFNLGFLKLQDTRHKKWSPSSSYHPENKLQGTHAVLRRTLDAITASHALASLCAHVGADKYHTGDTGGGGGSGVSDYCLPAGLAPSWLGYRGQQCCGTSEQRLMIGDWYNHPSSDDSTQASTY